MGGNMNVGEDEIYPWLPKEKELIKAAIKACKKVIGICLGAQLIATAVSCKVYPASQKEIGFKKISISDSMIILQCPIFYCSGIFKRNMLKAMNMHDGFILKINLQ